MTQKDIHVPCLAIGIFLIVADSICAQTPPATLTFPAKVRDMHECINDSASDYGDNQPSNCTAANVNLDFEHFGTCNDTGYVAQMISTTGDVGDTTVFPMDNRTPVKTLKLSSSASAGNHPCYTSVANFDTWYNDRIDPSHPGSAQDINRPFITNLTFNFNQNTGLYEFNAADASFFPLDSNAFNPGTALYKTQVIPGDNPNIFGDLQYRNTAPYNTADYQHDFGFTTEFHLFFTYLQGKGQVFTFSGDDDVWVFLNGHLAIDLGGVHAEETQSVNLDNVSAQFGMANNQSYILDFFLAERHSTGSHCQITTSLHLTQLPTVGKPVATPPGMTTDSSYTFLTTPLAVALSDTTPGATIFYSFNGSAPVAGTGLSITQSGVLKAYATAAGMNPSDTLTLQYILAGTTLPPTANPPSKTFTASDPAFSVTLTPGETGVVIHYTLDGSIPDSSSPVYTGPIPITTTTTLRAIDTKTNQTPSAVVTFVYTKMTLPPTANPAGETFTTLDPAVSVTLTPGETGAVIHYTLNGSMPDSSSPVYTGPIPITTTTTLQAIDTKTNQTPSPVVSFVYTETIAAKVGTPIATPPGLTRDTSYIFSTSPLTLVLSDTTPGATIFYSFDGAAPATGSNLFVTQSGVLHAYATKTGMYPSDTLTLHYFFNAPSKVTVQFANGQNIPPSRNVVIPDPTSPPNIVFIPIDQNGVALTGNSEGKCGTCFVGGVDGTPFVGPVINLEIPGPSKYYFQIYSKYGDYMVSGSGQIDAADIPLLGLNAGGSKRVARIIWTGRCANGTRAGTGAYILRSLVTPISDSGSPPLPGTTTLLLFGVVR